MENFIFCAVSCENSKRLKTVIFFKTLHHQKVTQCLTMSQIHICRLKLLSTVQYIDSYSDMSTGILKKKKNPLETYYSINSHSQRFFRDRCSEKFLNIHRKTPVLELLFNKVTGLQYINIQLISTNPCGSSSFCIVCKGKWGIPHLPHPQDPP